MPACQERYDFRHQHGQNKGLDIFCGVPGDRNSFFYLRNQDDFSDLLCEPEPEPDRPEFSGFLITHDMIDRMEARMIADLEGEGFTLDSVPEESPHDCGHWTAREMA